MSTMGSFLGGSAVKNSPTGDPGLILSWEDPLEKEMATHSSIPCLENPTDRGAWRATVHGVAKESTLLTLLTEPLSTQAHIHARMQS